jgi:4-hydroxybenzoate polyprenyltransferase
VAFQAFLSFCFCASAVYVINDLRDAPLDRQHPVKRGRPFAAGELPWRSGVTMTVLLLVPGLLIAWNLSPAFACIVGGYCLAGVAYTFFLKQIVLMDVFWLAGLYTLRLIAGHVATNIARSAWLLVFSMFIFLSLALMKRFIALQELRQQNHRELKGHGSTASDLELVTTLGLVSGYLAVLVLALYVNSDQVAALYKRPILLLLVCPLLLYWISRVWLLAHRGRVHNDPTEFAFKDGSSYVVGALTLVIMWLAANH